MLSGLQERSLLFADRARLGFTEHTQGAFSQRRCGESPRVKFQSVIRRLQNTSSWTDSEAECRDAVCVGVLRNSTQERSLPIADRARLTVVKLRLPALGAVLTAFGTENSSCVELECGMTPLVRGDSAGSHSTLTLTGTLRLHSSVTPTL